MQRIFLRKGFKVVLLTCFAISTFTWLYSLGTVFEDNENGPIMPHKERQVKIEHLPQMADTKSKQDAELRKQSIPKQLNITIKPRPKPSPECSCTDPETGIEHDLCYHFESKIGKKFDCSILPHLKTLGLLDPTNLIDLKTQTIPDTNYPVLVSGASSSHWSEEERLISLVQKWLPNHRMVLYDLGLTEDNLKLAKSYCQIEVRKFPFEKYPANFKMLSQFRWKPVIIAEALKEFGSIWYMDSSVTWKKSDLSHVYALLNCRGHSREGPRPVPVKIPDPKWVETGFHMDLWRDSIWKCDKFAYMLQGWTGHGIFPATHPHVYKYLPTNEELLKTERAKMYEAGFIFAVRTEEVIEKVLKWYVACAFEPGCMGPPGASLGCRFGPDRYSQFANCHRFDQSVVNLLLANVNHFDSYFYASGIVDFFNIVRGGSKKGEMCIKT